MATETMLLSLYSRKAGNTPMQHLSYMLACPFGTSQDVLDVIHYCLNRVGTSRQICEIPVALSFIRFFLKKKTGVSIEIYPIDTIGFFSIDTVARKTSQTDNDDNTLFR